MTHSSTLQQDWDHAANEGWLVQRSRFWANGIEIPLGLARVTRITKARVYYYCSRESPEYLEHWVPRSTLADPANYASIRLSSLPPWADPGVTKTQSQPKSE